MSIKKIIISDCFSTAVHQASSQLLRSNPKPEYSNAEILEAGKAVAKDTIPHMKADEVHALMSFHSSDSNFIVLSSDLMTELPDTPIDAVISNKEIIEPVLFVTAIHSLLGLYPVVYEGENDGRIVRNVVPARQAAGVISSHGSKVAFGAHVDNPDLPFYDDAEIHSVSIPDNLSLYCLRQQEPAVSTDLIMLDEVLAQMQPQDVSALMKPVFTVERPASFSGYTDNRVCDVPLIARNNRGQFVSRIDTHRVSTLNPEASRALEEFKSVASRNDSKTSLFLERGDLVIFKNKRALHARGAFNPAFNGKDRWLLRVFSMNAKPPGDILVDMSDPTHLKTTVNAFNPC